MANKPPKHPSAANMGMCVRTYKDGMYHDIDPALSAGGGCGWLVVCGISVGVSCVTTKNGYVRSPWARARVPDRVSNSRLFALAPQVYLLKNQPKPYTKSSFNFKLIFVATSKERLTSTWFQERSMTPDAALQLFEDFDKSLFSDPWLLDGDAVINAFVDGVNAKTILGEYGG